jgi:hypothetical protein
MSLLYKDPKDVIYTADINISEGKVDMVFYADCGKHGMDERLDSYKLTPKRLLEILQDRNDYKEEEI